MSDFKAIGDKSKKDKWYDPNLASKLEKAPAPEPKVNVPVSAPQTDAKSGIYVALKGKEYNFIYHLPMDRILDPAIGSPNLTLETLIGAGIVLATGTRRRSKHETINALCFHDGILHDAAGRYIANSGSEHPLGTVYQAGDNITALCDQDGALYFAEGKEVRKLITPGRGQPVATRPNKVYSLSVRTGKLLDASGAHYGQMKNIEIRDTLGDPKGDKKAVASTGEWIHTMCSHLHELLVNELQGIATVDELNGAIHQYGSIRRDSDVTALCSFGGRLYDAAGSKIYDTLNNKVIIDMQARITAMCSYEGKDSKDTAKPESCPNCLGEMISKNGMLRCQNCGMVKVTP